MDAGGSAQMFVKDRIVNRATAPLKKDIAFLGLLEQFLFEPRSHGDVV